MSLLTEIRKHKETILRYARQRGLKDIYILGPVAREEEKPTSSVVFLVSLEWGHNLYDMVQFAKEVEPFLDRHVDVIAAQSLNWFIKEEILRTAIPL